MSVTGSGQVTYAGDSRYVKAEELLRDNSHYRALLEGLLIHAALSGSNGDFVKPARKSWVDLCH